MTSGQRVGKPKAVLCVMVSFPSSSEVVIVRLPVENMSTKPTPQRIIGTDALASLATTLAVHAPARTVLLVCDEQTWEAAGEKTQAQLPNPKAASRHSLGKYVEPTLERASDLAARAGDYDALIAIGSGTVNDLTKYAAAQCGKPYLVVATAASMNGYTATNASLIEDGFKHSFAAAPPRAVVADTGILAAAPKRLTRAGLGDTLCRSTVEADMLLSHWLLGTDYPRALFDRMRRHEAELIALAPAAREGDASFVGKLMEALLDAGDAMTEHGSSAPASQSEHMIAHTLELMYGQEFRHMLHGEVVALTTLTMGQLQHKMLLSTPVVKPLPRELAQFERVFGRKVAPALFSAYQQKLLDATQTQHINAKLPTQWPEIKSALAEVMIPANSIERALIQSGLATRASDLGLEIERYRNACAYAYLTRNRFTFLDLAVMNDRRIEAK